MGHETGVCPAQAPCIRQALLSGQNLASSRAQLAQVWCGCLLLGVQSAVQYMSSLMRFACTAQFLWAWRYRQQDSCFDACTCALLQSIAGAAAEQGLKVLQAPSMQVVLAAVAHPRSAALVLRSLLALPQPKDAKSGKKTVSAATLSAQCAIAIVQCDMETHIQLQAMRRHSAFS